MKSNSSLTFNDLTKDLAFVKVYWNGYMIYSDTYDICFDDDEELYRCYGKEFVETHFGKGGLSYLQEHYGNKIVYQMNITIVENHHCILSITGE